MAQAQGDDMRKKAAQAAFWTVAIIFVYLAAASYAIKPRN
jgi:hypothetical protein